MTCANRMGQAAEHVSNLALGVCGALLICIAVMLIPSPGQAAACLLYTSPSPRD